MEAPGAVGSGHVMCSCDADWTSPMPYASPESLTSETHPRLCCSANLPGRRFRGDQGRSLFVPFAECPNGTQLLQRALCFWIGKGSVLGVQPYPTTCLKHPRPYLVTIKRDPQCHDSGTKFWHANLEFWHANLGSVAEGVMSEKSQDLRLRAARELRASRGSGSRQQQQESRKRARAFKALSENQEWLDGDKQKSKTCEP